MKLTNREIKKAILSKLTLARNPARIKILTGLSKNVGDIAWQLKCLKSYAKDWDNPNQMAYGSTARFITKLLK